MKESGEDFLLVDVREPAEWEIVRIPGAQLIPKGDIPSQARGAAAGQADRPVLQDRCAFGGGAGDPEGRRVQHRQARPGRRHGMGDPGRQGPAGLLIRQLRPGGVERSRRDRCRPGSARVRSSGGKPSAYAAQVLDIVDRIPRGKVLTYGDIAEMIGRGSGRAVGAGDEPSRARGRLASRRAVQRPSEPGRAGRGAAPAEGRRHPAAPRRRARRPCAARWDGRRKSPPLRTG